MGGKNNKGRENYLWKDIVIGDIMGFKRKR